MEKTDGKLEAAIGITLKRLRATTGLSQEDLAFATGLHRTYVSQLERGKKNVTLRVLLLISKALKVGIVELVTMIDDEHEKL